MIEFRANGDTAPGYLARPEGGGPFPGVVVIQEWWGLNQQIKGVADRLANAGFVALVPDLYGGQVTEEPDEARKMVMNLNRPQAMKVIQGAVEYLVRHPDVEPKKAGVIGFCVGGSIAAAMAFTGYDLGAAVVFYGTPPLDQMSHVAVPLLGLYGEDDQSIPLAKVEEFRQKLAEQGDDHEIRIYPGAGHAFANEERDAYRPEAAEDAWKRSVDWLKRFLHYP